MPFFFLSIYFRPFIDRALEAQSQNCPAKGRHRCIYIQGVCQTVKEPQQADMLPLTHSASLSFAAQPLCGADGIRASRSPALSLPSAAAPRSPQALSQSLRVDIAALSCPPRAPLVPSAECTETHYCPIKALGSENEGSHKATHRGFGALTYPASQINRLYVAVSP